MHVSMCSWCGLQLYLAANSVLDGSGHLVMVTDRASVKGPGGQVYNFTSGWVDTQNRFSWTYGLWEVHARLPAASAGGCWPAHWLMPDGRCVGLRQVVCGMVSSCVLYLVT